MSKINSTGIIHIAAEIILIGGIVFYFNNQIKSLRNEIKELRQKAQDNQEIYNKHFNNIYAGLDKLVKLQDGTPIKKSTKKSRKESPAITTPSVIIPPSTPKNEDEDLDKDLEDELNRLEEEEEELEIEIDLIEQSVNILKDVIEPEVKPVTTEIKHILPEIKKEDHKSKTSEIKKKEIVEDKKSIKKISKKIKSTPPPCNESDDDTEAIEVNITNGESTIHIPELSK